MNMATQDHAKRSTKHRVLLGLGGAFTVAALVTAGTVSANAATSDGSTDGHVVVGTAISLSALDSNFTLTGIPGSTPTTSPAVGFNVETNNLAGYDVTVESATSTLVADTAGNTDSIPIANLSVSGDGGATYTPLSSTSADVVHTQSARSAEGGDALTNDYRVVIPFVNSDTYSVTINYIAATL